jgi:hypothetical protein
MKTILTAAALALLAATASAKLPPLSDEAKAKAAEAAAKAAHGNKVADFQLCKSREKTAAHYYKSAKAAGKETRPPMDTPACADPGPYVPAAPTVAAAPAAAPVAAAAAAAAAKK